MHIKPIPIGMAKAPRSMAFYMDRSQEVMDGAAYAWLLQGSGKNRSRGAAMVESDEGLCSPALCASRGNRSVGGGSNGQLTNCPVEALAIGVLTTRVKSCPW